MSICIIHDAGNYWTNEYENVKDVVNAIESGAEIKVWWFQTHGQRYSETMWFDPEGLQEVRTENDDG